MSIFRGTNHNKIRISAVFLAIVFTTVITINSKTQSTVFAASPGDVIINELMYNPNTGNQFDEFLELYNTTGSSINISGWSFSAGVVLTFDPGTTIPANGYIVVSPSISQTLTTYGAVASAQYTPSNLSNGGEAITLVDDSSAVIDTVTYDDVSPWPTSPDGTGPSLELKDTASDNTLAASWGAGIANGGTPLAQNSQVGLTLPSVTGVNDPNDVTDSQDITITAQVTGSTNVVLKYKLNFDADVSVTMFDDGAHNDGASGDDVYGAEIPAQAQKTLVRFKVEATNGSGTQSSPSIDDSKDYHGYYIKDPSVTSTAPIVEWFITDADYTDMVTNHVLDNVYLPSVVIYGNEVFDNSRVRIRGDGREGPKYPLKFKLPAGYEFDLDGGSNIATDEFEMLSYVFDSSGWLPVIGWLNEQVGLPPYDILPTRVQRNGDYQGLYYYANKYQKQWRVANGYDSGELYEDTQFVVSGANDLTRMNDLYNNVYSTADIDTPTQRDYVLDNFDIPKTLNLLSAMGLVSGWDHYNANNTLQYFDPATGRWSSLLWDQGGIFKNSPGVSPYDGRGSAIEGCWSYCPVYNQIELRELYLRRFRTLVDKLYSGDQLVNKFNELNALQESEMVLERAAWPGQRGYTASEFRGRLEFQKQNLLSLMTGYSWGIPAAQTQEERESVLIDQIVSDTNNANEYIKLSSTASTPVDISGWTIEGINYTIPQGSVVPANGSIYLLRDDIGYKAGHSAVLVAGQYSNDLGASGTLVLKTDAGVTIDTGSYSL